jgi:mercuric ion binding protein
MNRLLRITAMFAVLVSPAAAAERTVKLSVANMTCITCPLIVRQSLAAVPGVTAVEVAFPGNTAVVTFDDATASIDALIKATGDAGFPSSLIEGQPS